MLLKLDTGGPDAISARMLKHTDSAMLTQNYYKQKKVVLAATPEYRQLERDYLCCMYSSANSFIAA